MEMKKRPSDTSKIEPVSDVGKSIELRTKHGRVLVSDGIDGIEIHLLDYSICIQPLFDNQIVIIPR